MENGRRGHPGHFAVCHVVTQAPDGGQDLAPIHLQMPKAWIALGVKLIIRSVLMALVSKQPQKG